MILVLDPYINETVPSPIFFKNLILDLKVKYSSGLFGAHGSKLTINLKLAPSFKFATKKSRFWFWFWFEFHT
jgi:hypothetical protein